MSDIAAAIMDARRRWIAPDGLMSLEPSNFRAAYVSGPDTVREDNGLLFRAYFEMLAERHGLEDWADFNLAVQRCERTPGLYDRNPGRTDSLNSLDNYVAVAMSRTHAKRLCEYGREHNWHFNNLDDKLRWSTWRQPSDVAFYKLRAWEDPSWLETVWLKSGLYVNATQGIGNTSEYLMSWLRVEGITSVNRTDVLGGALGSWHAAVRTLGGIGKIFERYFQHPEHPCRLLSKEMDY